MVKVSVIIPIYNTEKYLERCLESVCNQTLFDIEIICVNDASTDNSLALIQAWAGKDNRIKIIDFKENKGAAAARNAGIDAATGEYLGFVDSDDFIDLDFYEKLYNKAKETGADITKGNMVNVRDGNICCNVYYNLDEVKINKVKFNHVPTAIFNKLFLQKNHLYYPTDLKCAEDAVFEVSFALKCNKIEIEDKTNYYYDYRSGSLNHPSEINIDKLKEIEKSTNRVIDLFNAAEIDKNTYLEGIETRYNYLSFFIKDKEILPECAEYVKNAEAKIYAKVKHLSEIQLKQKIKKRLQDLFEKKRIEELHKRICEIGIDKTAVDKEMATFAESKMEKTPQLIVSLTSFPPRMKDIHYCLFSLLNQSIHPEKTILWLGKEQFPNGMSDIPKKVLDLQKFGLTIEFTKDIKSYKKLIPALKKYPNDIIVTADDDVYYPYNWLENLYLAYQKNDDCVISYRTHKIKMLNDKVLPYNKWDTCINDNTKGYLNFATGVGGILYPSGLFKTDIFNEDNFFKLCPYADDVWFWAMTVLNGKKIKNIGCFPLKYLNPEMELGLTEDKTLFAINITENDKQIANVLNFYPKIQEILKNEP